MQFLKKLSLDAEIGTKKKHKSYFSKEFRTYLKSKFGKNIRRNLLDTLSSKHGVKKKDKKVKLYA